LTTLKNKFSLLRAKQFASLFLCLSLLTSLPVNQSCDPLATGVIDLEQVVNSEEYFDFAQTYMSAFSIIMPVIEGLDYADSYHFWAHLDIYNTNHDTAQISYLFNLLQDNTEIDLMPVCYSVAEAGEDLLQAYPALNLATIEQFQELTELGFDLNIWPESFPNLIPPLKSGLEETNTCKICKRNYRWAKVGAIAEVTFGFVAGGVELLVPVPGAQVLSLATVALSTGNYINKAINIEIIYATCLDTCHY